LIEPDYEDMLLGPAGVVKMVLDRCPGSGAQVWDGQLDGREVREEVIETAGDIQYQSKPTGVRLKHLPTGIVRESQSKGDYEDNKRVAWDALTSAVDKRYREMHV
jgi:protein subunit release factor A